MVQGDPVFQGKHVMVTAYLGLGRMGNNCYVLAAAAGDGAVTIVDIPEGVEAVLDDLGGTPVERAVVTHSHFDHWLGWDAFRPRLDAPVYAGAAETDLDASRDVQPLGDGEVFHVGEAQVQVIHTPGHTPGSICLLVEGVLLTGDTLFPGGPGRTRSAEDLQTEIGSIATRLLTLDPGTLVLPGHGPATTIGTAKQEYEDFVSREHDPDLHGDVLWAQS